MLSRPAARVLRRVQLWGAALPLNSPRVPCILDPVARVGVAMMSYFSWNAFMAARMGRRSRMACR